MSSSVNNSDIKPKLRSSGTATKACGAKGKDQPDVSAQFITIKMQLATLTLAKLPAFILKILGILTVRFGSPPTTKAGFLALGISLCSVVAHAQYPARRIPRLPVD